MKDIIGIIAVILTFVGYAPYVWDTVSSLLIIRRKQIA